MSDTLNQPWMREKHLKAIIEALGKTNVRFVGGCVRDALMHREIGDVDMATSLLPQDVTAKLEKKRIKVVPTGIDHGTVTAISGGVPIEITTLRSDKACDGRHATVTFTDSWKADAERRDFTFNALSCDADGKIYDYTGGMHDLIARRLRFIGNARNRCQEDFLRILRYFRFYATLAIEKIDDAALSACEKEASGIETLSGERIQNEMFRLLEAPSPLRALKMMEKTGILEKVMLLAVNTEVMANLEAIENSTENRTDAITRLAALCRYSHASGNDVEVLINRWKLSNQDKQRLKTLCFPPQPLDRDRNNHEQKKLIRLYGKETYLALLMIAWALDENTAQDWRYLMLITLVREWHIPTFPLHGQDLIELGMKPGKSLGQLLKRAEDFWEKEQYAPDKKTLLRWVTKQMD